MKLLFASDSFKGSLSSKQIIELLTRAARNVFDNAECKGIPLADGGEGTVDAVIEAVGGEKVFADVTGPLFEKVHTYYGKISDSRAILEMASASGLPLVPASLRNPLNTTSYGTGELIRDALDKGFTDISIAIGGSATNDGGIGCLIALGARVLDKEGVELQGVGSDLEKIHFIDISRMDPRLKNTSFTVMSDVKNPLCGKDGATYTFGKQKGGTPEVLSRLEQGMLNYKNIVLRDFGCDPDKIDGGGAAGGLGTALCVFLNGQMKSGIESVLDLISFDSLINDVDLVITGEGRTDWQTCFGKVVQGVGDRCKMHGVHVAVLSGSLGEGADAVFEHGADAIMTTVHSPMSLEEALDRAPELYKRSAEQMFRLIKLGMNMTC